MRRLFWISLGATAGVLIVRRISRAQASLSPQGMAASLQRAAADLAGAIRDFAVEVRAGMAEREAELRRDLGLDDAAAIDLEALGRPDLPSGASGLAVHRATDQAADQVAADQAVQDQAAQDQAAETSPVSRATGEDR